MPRKDLTFLLGSSAPNRPIPASGERQKERDHIVESAVKWLEMDALSTSAMDGETMLDGVVAWLEMVRAHTLSPAQTHEAKQSAEPSMVLIIKRKANCVHDA